MLKLPAHLRLLPLVKTNELIVSAKKIHKNLQKIFSCQYDEKDSIGKRYRRQDAIGTPYCITIDHNSIKDNMVTVRDRDTMSQERIPIEQICDRIKSKLYT
jgi:glycyl-tRNA synthetase